MKLKVGDRVVCLYTLRGDRSRNPRATVIEVRLDYMHYRLDFDGKGYKSITRPFTLTPILESVFDSPVYQLLKDENETLD